MRVVIADDSVLWREGLSRLLAEAGVETVEMVGDGAGLEAALERLEVDLAIVDIRMPPTFTHEGAATAVRIRDGGSRIPILLLSQSLESRYAAELARRYPSGLGYLLKDRVVDPSTLVDALNQIAGGGTVLDPGVVAHLLGASLDRLAVLTQREREVLGLMAQGRSNAAIGRALHLTGKTVETHIARIFTKLELLPEPEDHRRVLAYLS